MLAGVEAPRSDAAAGRRQVERRIQREIEEELGAGYDDELDLVHRSGLVLRVGRMSLASGTGSYRVKNHMANVAAALGIERHHALVTLTEITTTSHRGHSFRTEVTELREVGVNADRLVRLQDLVGSLAGRSIEPAELERRLDAIEARQPLYPWYLSGLFAGIACGAFAFLLGEGWGELIAAAVGAALGQMTRRLMHHARANIIGTTMVAALVASLSYLALTWVLGATLGEAWGGSNGYIAAVLFLVPGFPLVTAALDLARLDISAGVARLTYAVMIVSAAAVVVWGIAHTLGGAPDPAVTPDHDLWGRLAQLVASFAGVLGFALMFNSPWRVALTAAAVGAGPNVARILMVDSGTPPAVAAASAALVVGVVAAYVAPAIGSPRVIVSVPAVVIMVPGTTTYLAMSGLGDGATSSAIAYGVQACVVMLGIAIGLAVARMLTDREWGFEARQPRAR